MNSDHEGPLPDLLRQRKHPAPLWRRVLYLLAAAVFFVLGVAFWLMPVVTGIPFHLVAIVFLGLASNRAREWLNAMERKLSYAHRLKLREWLRKAPIRRIREMGTLHEEQRESPSREVAGSAREA